MAEDLSPLERYRLDLQGYLLFESVLEPQLRGRLLEAIAAQHLPPPGRSIPSQRFGTHGRLFDWDEGFAELVDHPLVLAVLRELIGPHVRLDHAYGIAMDAGTEGLGLHGPAMPFDPAQYYLTRAGQPRSGLLSFSWALSDGRPGQGGFGCIPGSHRSERPIPEGAESLVVEVAQPAGSLLVFTEALVHCTLAWQGPSQRLVILYKYSPGNSAWDPSPAASESALAAMPPARRELFQPPSVGAHRSVF